MKNIITITDTRVEYASIHDELDAMDVWIDKSPFGKMLKSIRKATKGIEPEEMTDWGFTTTPLASVMETYCYGFNGHAVSCARAVVFHLANHDYIAIGQNGKASMANSNHPNIARLANKLMDMVGINGPWVHERLMY